MNISDITSSSSDEPNKIIKEAKLPKFVAGLLIGAGSLGVIGALAIVLELATGAQASAFFAVTLPVALINPVIAALIGGGALLLLIIGCAIFLSFREKTSEEDFLAVVRTEEVDNNFVIEVPLGVNAKQILSAAEMSDISITYLNESFSIERLEELCIQDEMPDPIYRFKDGILAVFLLNHSKEKEFVYYDSADNLCYSQGSSKYFQRSGSIGDLLSILAGQRSLGRHLVPHKVSEQEILNGIVLLNHRHPREQISLLDDKGPLILRDGGRAMIIKIQENPQDRWETIHAALIFNAEGECEQALGADLEGDDIEGFLSALQKNKASYTDSKSKTWTVIKDI